LNRYEGDLSLDEKAIIGRVICLQAASGNTFSQGQTGTFTMTRIGENNPTVMKDPWEDRELVFEAVKQDWQALNFACEVLRADRELLLLCVRQCWESIKIASGQQLQCSCPQDREIILEAVRQHWKAVEFVSKDWTTDRDIVLAAVAQNHKLFSLVSEKLRNDREVALVVLKKDGGALAL